MTVSVSVSAAIPDLTEEQVIAHYDRAAAAPEIRAAGYEGFTIHEEDDRKYVTLLLYERDPSEITARLTMKSESLVQVVDALTAMIKDRKLRR